MPIHDRSYQHWQGQYSTTPAALILGGSQMKVVLGRKIVRFLMLLGGVFFLVFLGLLYVETMQAGGSFGEVPNVRMDETSIYIFLARQKLLHLLFCIAAGADLIALDRQNKSLQIYLSRPLRTPDYIFAKAIPLLFLLSLSSWIPALFLLLLKCLMNTDLSWLRAAPALPLSILGYSAVMIVPLTMLTLSISSLSNSPRFAAAQLFAALLISRGTTLILSELTNNDLWNLLSPLALLDQLSSWMFGRAVPYDFPALLALLSLLAMTAIAAMILRSRVRPIDIVGSS